jgi:translation initiation factor RLI1
LRFRDDELTFKVVENDADKEKAAAEESKNHAKPTNWRYPEMTKTMDAFKISVQPGQF